jgi:hypothetical protein
MATKTTRGRKQRDWREEMDTAKDEDQRVLIWRRVTFEDMGFTRAQSLRLAETTHHSDYVAGILAQSDHRTVVRILA